MPGRSERVPTVGASNLDTISESELAHISPVQTEDPEKDEDSNDLDGQDDQAGWIPEEPPQKPKVRSKKLGLKNFYTSPQAQDPRDYTHKYAEDPPHKEMGATARVWKVYNDEAAKFDTDMVDDWKDGLDMLLVFAALFSAVLTTFVVQTSQSLSPNYTEVTASLMVELIAVARASASGASVDSVPASLLTPSSHFTPRPVDIAVNAFWFLGLSLSLSTALIAIVAKQWIHQYTMIPSGSPRDRARIRQARLQALGRWHVPAIIGLLPTVIHISLGVFFAGLVVFLHDLSHIIAGIIDATVFVTLVAYVGANLMSVLFVECPYKTPVSVYCFRAMQSLLAKAGLRRQHSNHNLSLRDAERAIVKAHGTTTDVHATAWLLSVSSDVSVQTVVLQAISNMPLGQVSAFRELAPSHLASMIHESTSSTWNGSDGAQVERAMRAHLRFSPSADAGKLLRPGQVTRLARFELTEHTAVNTVIKYLYIDLHHYHWMNSSRFPPIRCTLPLIQDAMREGYDAPRCEPLVWITFFNMAARWSDSPFLKQDIQSQFLKLVVEHSPIKRPVAMPGFDPELVGYARQAPIGKKQSSKAPLLAMSFCAVRPPFAGDKKTKGDMHASHTSGHTLPHTLRHHAFSSFCDYMAASLPGISGMTEPADIGERVPNHLCLLLRLVRSPQARSRWSDMAVEAMHTVEDYARSASFATPDMDCTAEAKAILYTASELLVDADFLVDAAMSTSPTKKTLSGHGRFLLALLLISNRERVMFREWATPVTMRAIIDLTRAAIIPSKEAYRMIECPNNESVLLAYAPLVVFLDVATHREDLLVPFYNHIISTDYLQSKLPRIPYTFVLSYVDGLSRLEVADQAVYKQALAYTSKRTILLRVCQSLLRRREYKRAFDLARRSRDHKVAWKRMLAGLKRAIPGYDDWEEREKEEVLHFADRILDFVENDVEEPADEVMEKMEVPAQSHCEEKIEHLGTGWLATTLSTFRRRRSALPDAEKALLPV